MIWLREWIKQARRELSAETFWNLLRSHRPETRRPAHIQQWLTLDEKGNATSGSFTIDEYDEGANLLAHVQGKIIGTRVTMGIGFEKVE